MVLMLLSFDLIPWNIAIPLCRTVVCGDADELSPLVKIQAAVTRETDGAPDVATAIEWMTINPARLLHQDKTTGSIEVGKLADLAVIDRDITEIPAKQVGEAKVVATLLQGEPVYDPDGMFDE